MTLTNQYQSGTFSLRTMFTVVTLAAVLMVVVQWMNRGVIAESDGLRIRTGTPAAEVLKKLGPPKQITKSACGPKSWLYSCGWLLGSAWLSIEFDEQDRVTSVDSWN